MSRDKGGTWILRRIFYSLLIVVLLILVVAGCFLSELLYRFEDVPNGGKGKKVWVEIPYGAGPATVSRLLADSGLITNQWKFEIWLRIRGYPSKLHAGRHFFSDNASPEELAIILSSPGHGPQVRVTIPEGSTMFDIAGILDDAGVTDSGEFTALCLDRKMLDRLGISGTSVEGFLFPDTYKFEPDTAATDVIKRLVDTFGEKYSMLSGRYTARVEKLEKVFGNAQRAAVTIASLVEAEAAVDAERPLVAQVFYNRLFSASFPSRLLQSDPSVVYGCIVDTGGLIPSCREFADRLTRRQLDDFSNPYNTYRRAGLPPGPICNPGVASLNAALDPAQGELLYFVARNDGTHVFSKTLPEHNRAVARYQRDLKQGKGGR